MDTTKIEKFIWEHMKFELTHGGTVLSKTQHGIIITFSVASHMKGMGVMRVLNGLEKRGLGHFVCDLRIVIAPNVSIEDKINLAEIKASLVGTKVLKHQEQTIVLLASFKDALQELKDLKALNKAEKGAEVETV